MTHDYCIAFPGQGTQRPGMAKDFADAYPESRAIFERADTILGFDLTAICHQEDERLNLTEYTQPAILAAEMAMFVAAKVRYGLAPIAFAGHSLGEYTALVAAQAMPFEVALELVHLRGKLMQQAVPAGVGAMAALALKTALPLGTIRELARQHEVDIANENSPNQVVLSGDEQALKRAADAISARVPNIRITWLRVSAPFHSRHMAGIEPEFRAALNAQRTSFHADAAKVVTSNFLGGFHTGDTDALINALTRQISSPVRWVDNMKTLCAVGGRVVEMGPNRPLRKFFKVIGHSVSAVIDVRSARRVLGKAAGAVPGLSTSASDTQGRAKA